MKIIASFVAIPELIALYTAFAVGTSEFVDSGATLILKDIQVGAAFPLELRICPEVPPVVGAKKLTPVEALLLKLVAEPFKVTVNLLFNVPDNPVALNKPVTALYVNAVLFSNEPVLLVSVDVKVK